jgi:lysophospholipase L1-like esterase
MKSITGKGIIAGMMFLLFFIKPGSTQELDSLKYFDASLFQLIGKGFADTESRYGRLPARLKEVTRIQVWNLSTNSSGLAIRFRSNSRVISAKWEVTEDVVMNHFTPTGIKGLDLYCLVNGTWQFVNSARPSGKSSKAVIISNMTDEDREFMLYLPLYDGLSHLEIGIEAGATIGDPLVDSPRRDKPVVFYGTSITQGGCATRAGMAYPGILSRMLDRQTINLGFSGNGKLDPEIAEAMTEVDASCYVIDCLPNVTTQMMEEKFVDFLEIIREKKPEVPIVLVENIPYTHMAYDQEVSSLIAEKNSLLKVIWKDMRKKGDRNIHYIKGDRLIGDDLEGTVDGVHLTDLGFLRMSRILYPELRKLIK